jgi:ADP-ribose pyrophosphatase
VYTGRVFRVEHETVLLPHGKTTAMDIVRHRGSVVLVPQPDPTSVILIRQYRHAIRQWLWELPAGTLEAGEQPRAAARRECEEEIGLRPKRLQKLGAYYATPGFCDELMIFYGCSDLVRPRRLPQKDEDEQISTRVFSLAQVAGLIERRRIVDMKTVVGLYLIRSSAQRAGGMGAAARRVDRKRA